MVDLCGNVRDVELVYPPYEGVGWTAHHGSHHVDHLRELLGGGGSGGRNALTSGL